MLKVLVDSNVLVDFLAVRGEFYAPARKLMIFAGMGDYELWMSSSQVTDLFYILSGGGHVAETDVARASLEALRQIVHVCGVGEREVDRALLSPWSDFEDAVVYQAADSIDAEAIVTRNESDFSRSAIPVLSPEDFFAWMEQHKHVAYEDVDF